MEEQKDMIKEQQNIILQQDAIITTEKESPGKSERGRAGYERRTRMNKNSPDRSQSRIDDERAKSLSRMGTSNAEESPERSFSRMGSQSISFSPTRPFDTNGSNRQSPERCFSSLGNEYTCRMIKEGKEDNAGIIPSNEKK